MIIVCYNSYDLLTKCVKSIVDRGVVKSCDIIIVDNNSPDGSGMRIVEDYKECTVILSNQNKGYGAGINIGLMAARKDFVLIVNPDTYFICNNIENAISEFSRDDTLGLVGLNLLNPDGTLQYSARRFYSIFDVLLRRSVIGGLRIFKNRIRRHLMVDKYKDKIFESDWVMGTGILLQREFFMEIGGMDESYFLYMEDVDLCTRVWLQGKKVKMMTEVSLIHEHQRSSASGLFSKAGISHLKSLIKYGKKYGLPLYSFTENDRIRMKNRVTNQKVKE